MVFELSLCLYAVFLWALGGATSVHGIWARFTSFVRRVFLGTPYPLSKLLPLSAFLINSLLWVSITHSWRQIASLSLVCSCWMFCVSQNCLFLNCQLCVADFSRGTQVGLLTNPCLCLSCSELCIGHQQPGYSLLDVADTMPTSPLFL